jgi:fatty-acid desaturase
MVRPERPMVFAFLYALTGLGVAVGFHRLFTHRACLGSSQAAQASNSVSAVGLKVVGNATSTALQPRRR